MSDDQQARLAEISLIASKPEGHGWLRQAEWQRLLDVAKGRAEAAEARIDELVRAYSSEIETLRARERAKDARAQADVCESVITLRRLVHQLADALAQQPADQSAQGERLDEGPDTYAAGYLEGFERGMRHSPEYWLERAARVARKRRDEWRNANGFGGHSAAANIIMAQIRNLRDGGET